MNFFPSRVVLYDCDNHVGSLKVQTVLSHLARTLVLTSTVVHGRHETLSKYVVSGNIYISSQHEYPVSDACHCNTGMSAYYNSVSLNCAKI